MTAAHRVLLFSLLFLLTAQLVLGNVVINEVMPNPTSGTEWIELYNKTSREIDLTGWWLEDGSSAKTKLEGLINVSGSNRYKIVEKPNGNLNKNLTLRSMPQSTF